MLKRLRWPGPKSAHDLQPFPWPGGLLHGKGALGSSVTTTRTFKNKEEKIFEKLRFPHETIMSCLERGT